ncbi:hypothetical protein OYC64_004217 [Pagothenia borchgrevinki]|uniref:Uncharacterized protein n=1 Tax=Pagothenia borchgrevinki TaxID=8213 RepID=A0ABD2FWS9_PAGBO
MRFKPLAFRGSPSGSSD